MSKANVDFLIRAKDGASKVLSQLNQTLKDTAKQNSETASSTGKLTTQTEALQQQLDGLSASLKRVKQAQAATKTLVGMTSDLEANSAQLAKAREEQRKYADAVEQARTPADKLRNTLQAQKQALAGMERQLVRAKDKLDDLGTQLSTGAINAAQFKAQSETAQKKVDKLTASIDRQNTSIAKTNAEYQTAAATLAQAQASYQTASASAAALARENKQLSGTVTKLQADLRTAGVSSESLQKSESDLISKEKQLRQQITQTNEALEKQKGKSNSVTDAFNRLFRASRTSMSVYQRLRGQILSITAAYVGLYGAIDQLRSVVDVYRQIQAANARFRVAFEGDQKKAQQEMEFTRRAADDLGVDFLMAARNYSRLQIAAQGTNLAGENTRFIWTSMAASAKVLRASQEELDGVFTALEQIMSKGSVQAEELTGQLGDRLPGAVNIMAAALGKSTGELRKMMEQGQITRDSLVLMAEEMKKRYGKELPQAASDLDAQMARLGNTWRDVQMAFADSGFITELSYAVQQLNEALKSPEAKNGARERGKLVGDLVRGVVWLLENINKVKMALTALGAAMALKWVVGLGREIYALAQFFGLVYINIGKLGPAIVALLSRFVVLRTGVAAVLSALFGPAGIFIGLLVALGSYIAGWLYDQNKGFREWVNESKIILVGWIENWKWAFEAIKALGVAAFQYLANATAKALARSINTPLALIGSAIPDEKLQIFDNIPENLKKNLDEAAQIAERNKAIIAKQMRADFEAEEEKRAKSKPKAVAAPAVTAPGSILNEVQPVTEGLKPIVPGKDKEAEKRLKEQTRLAEQAADALKEVRDRMLDLRIEQAKGAEKLRLQMQEIDNKYAPTFEKLAKAGYAATSEQVRQVEALVAAEKKQLQTEAKKEAARDAEEKVNDLLERRQMIMDRIDYLNKQGDTATANGLKPVLKGVNDELQKAIDQAIKFAETLGDKNLILKLQGIRDSVAEVRQQVTTADDVNRDLAQGFTDVFAAGTEGIANMISEGAKLKDVFSGMRDAFLQFASDFLQQIAQMIMQQIVFNALKSMGWGSAISSGVNAAANAGAAVAHTGGVIGSVSRSRSVAAGVFAGAARFHSGGLPGLKPDEVPAILQRGEEVITRDDPRHVLNGGGSGGQAAQQQAPIQVINTLDVDQMAQAVLSSPSGARRVVNLIRANKTEVKTILGG